ncbi:uncharacterized protein UDID_20514 [Ustilago sp. UG-2017a]|nr:uncharacterized protein UDID_20514 [Ustilago sp. UG-2017a]
MDEVGVRGVSPSLRVRRNVRGEHVEEGYTKWMKWGDPWVLIVMGPVQKTSDLRSAQKIQDLQRMCRAHKDMKLAELQDPNRFQQTQAGCRFLAELSGTDERRITQSSLQASCKRGSGE